MKKEEIQDRARPLTGPAVGTEIKLLDGEGNGTVEQLVGPGLAGFIVYVKEIPFPLNVDQDKESGEWREVR